MPNVPLPVLLYHRVDDTGGEYATTPAVFRSHLAWLAERGYRTLSTADLDRALDDPNTPLPARSVMLTFDDGFDCLDREVAPALREYGFTAAAFLITGRSDETDRFERPEDQLSWASARRLATEGVLEFHTHTHTHGTWPRTAASADAVADDLARSRSLLAEHLGRPESAFTHVAWPYGRSHPSWEARAERLGLRTQYSVQRGAIDRRDRTRRLPRLLTDGMSTSALACWMATLSRPAGARAANVVFGTIRQARQGTAYR
ncbi:MAG: polysaccharide deacetylase family protein [Acidimicrobiales bacterium]